MKIKKVLFVINFYINTTPKQNNVFDHPSILKTINNTPIHHKLLASLEKMNVPDNIDVKFLFFAIGTDAQKHTRRKYLFGYNDGGIKQELKSMISQYNINSGIITNTDLTKFSGLENKEVFLRSDDYGSIRNLGFIFGNVYDADLLIQIDDDEIVPKTYLETAIDIVEKNEISAFSAFYIENNSFYPSAKDSLESWQKFKFMSKDIERLSKNNSIKPAIYGKGGNMVFTKEFFSNCCYPAYVLRGEDFSLVLASWCIYKNGNDKAKISPGNQIFKTYFCPFKEIAVQHFPVKQANKNQLFYLFKNLLRFAFDRNMIMNQDGLSREDIKEVGYYMYKMIEPDNYISYINDIFNEFKTKFSNNFSEKEISGTKLALLEAIDKLNNRNLFEEYKLLQTMYIKFIKDLKKTNQSP